MDNFDLGSEESKSNSQLFLIDEDGNTIQLVNCKAELVDIEPSEEKINFAKTISDIQNREFTFELDIKINTKLTRKKFYKLLMSEGVPRNFAKGLTILTHHRFHKYDISYLMPALSFFKYYSKVKNQHQRKDRDCYGPGITNRIFKGRKRSKEKA